MNLPHPNTFHSAAYTYYSEKENQYYYNKVHYLLFFLFFFTCFLALAVWNVAFCLNVSYKGRVARMFSSLCDFPLLYKPTTHFSLYYPINIDICENDESIWFHFKRHLLVLYFYWEIMVNCTWRTTQCTVVNRALNLKVVWVNSICTYIWMGLWLIEEFSMD